MHYEVEQKFRVTDLDAVRARLVQAGAERGESLDQSDTYYRHPVRDFAVTDEAFRLRRVGEAGVLTYKGPKLDATTKTRIEVEAALGLGRENLAIVDELLSRLGFQRVAVVAKRRETWTLVLDGCSIEAALDDVAGVGTFAELELSVEAADAERDAALAAGRKVLASAAASLGLDPGANERRSYLELLVEGTSATAL